MGLPSRRAWLAAAVIAPAFIAVGGMGLGSTLDHPVSPTRVVLASNDSGPNNPDSDISGPYDSDKTNIAPKAPSSGTGMECEDQGVGCDHDQSGSVLSSDNDEV
nr:hypothetical protein [Mycobacteroides franklinii]